MLEAYDHGWRSIASGGEAYDGVVPYSSQIYPNTPSSLPDNAPRNFVQTQKPVSHTGVQASDEAVRLVKQGMNLWGEVPKLER